jgi:hypothetical protein
MELPCPHCGGAETLTDRKVTEIKPIIPEDIQYDFKKGENDFRPTPVSLDVTLPLESIFPEISEPVGLDPASLKVYFQLSIEFQILLDKAPNYREGVYHWQLLLPDRLQEYGLTEDAWERISKVGDSDEVIQKHLNALIKQVHQ